MWERTKGQSTDEEPFTVLGKDVRFKGVARFNGTVQLDCYFEGDIHAAEVLVVGDDAIIQGTIHAGTVISSGKIRGDITASEKVQLLKAAVLIGNVQTPSFSIADGAYFKGYCDMGAASWATAPLIAQASAIEERSLPAQLIESNGGSPATPSNLMV